MCNKVGYFLVVLELSVLHLPLVSSFNFGAIFLKSFLQSTSKLQFTKKIKRRTCLETFNVSLLETSFSKGNDPCLFKQWGRSSDTFNNVADMPESCLCWILKWNTQAVVSSIFLLKSWQDFTDELTSDVLSVCKYLGNLKLHSFAAETG